MAAIPDLVERLATRCRCLTSTLRFDQESSPGVKVILPVYTHTLPLAWTEEEKKAQAPYLLVRWTGAEQHSTTCDLTVVYMALLYTAGSEMDGLLDTHRLQQALTPLGSRLPKHIKDNQLKGFKLQPPSKWWFGLPGAENSPVTGENRHPLYWLIGAQRYTMLTE